jgi:hypothetical protein
MTKRERRNKARTSAKKRAKGRAALHLLRVMNPGRKKPGAVRVRRLRGGGVSIIPIKVKKVKR